MPSLFRVGRYLVFFWSNENNEPIHVHVSAGKPGANATKVWLTSVGGCISANNNSKIPEADLGELLNIIAAQHDMICSEWKKHFSISDVRYYC